MAVGSVSFAIFLYLSCLGRAQVMIRIPDRATPVQHVLEAGGKVWLLSNGIAI